MKRALAFVPFVLSMAASTFAQTQSSADVWDALSSPAMDAPKTATIENVEIVRDRVHLSLMSGTVQFVKPVNGVVFGATFHGQGRLRVDPSDATEAQQLRLFTKRDALDLEFAEATFCFTDGLLNEMAGHLQWIEGRPSDNLYAKRQQEREDAGAEYVPKLFKSLMSPDKKHTAYFVIDLNTKEMGWIEVRYDAMQPEEFRLGRWVDLGTFKRRDYWMVWPAGDRDPRHVYDDPAERQDFLIPDYQLSTTVTEGAELTTTARLSVLPRYSGERVLLFHLNSNARVSLVRDGQGRSVKYWQAREGVRRRIPTAAMWPWRCRNRLRPTEPRCWSFSTEVSMSLRRRGKTATSAQLPIGTHGCFIQKLG